jgi:hypothetical protein
MTHNEQTRPHAFNRPWRPESGGAARSRMARRGRGLESLGSTAEGTKVPSASSVPRKRGRSSPFRVGSAVRSHWLEAA